MANYVIYTDASYDKEMCVAACGFVLLRNRKIIRHNVYLVANVKNSGDAEAYAAKIALDRLPKIKAIDFVALNTDYIGLTKRNRGWAGVALEFKQALQKIQNTGATVNVRYVIGHAENKYNCMIDKSCVTELRNYRKKILPKEK